MEILTLRISYLYMCFYETNIYHMLVLAKKLQENHMKDTNFEMLSTYNLKDNIEDSFISHTRKKYSVKTLCRWHWARHCVTYRMIPIKKSIILLKRTICQHKSPGSRVRGAMGQIHD